MTNVVDYNKYKDRYTANGLKTTSGRVSVDNGDVVAKAMRNVKTLKDLKAVMSDNGITDRYAKKNFGMRKMIVSNILRGMVRNGDKVTVGGKKVVNDGTLPVRATKKSAA